MAPVLGGTALGPFGKSSLSLALAVIGAQQLDRDLLLSRILHGHLVCVSEWKCCRLELQTNWNRKWCYCFGLTFPVLGVEIWRFLLHSLLSLTLW